MPRLQHSGLLVFSFSVHVCLYIAAAFMFVVTVLASMFVVIFLNCLNRTILILYVMCLRYLMVFFIDIFLQGMRFAI